MAGSGAILRVTEAFDRHAVDYDRVFSGTTLGETMRRRTWGVLDAVFSPGDRVLDLGCGTGTDAIHLGARGVEVDAIDVSGAMVRQTREKVERAGLALTIRCRHGEWSRFDAGTARFDGLYSNFGALNCGSGLDELRGFARRILRPEARLVLVAMSRFYPLEFAANALTGRFAAAVRRLGRRSSAVVSGVRFDVCYCSLGSLRRSLGPGFELEHAEALNLIVPAPGFGHLGERFPLLFDGLGGLDLWLGRYRPMRGWGDHFISVWRFRE